MLKMLLIILMNRTPLGLRVVLFRIFEIPVIQSDKAQTL